MHFNGLKEKTERKRGPRKKKHFPVLLFYHVSSVFNKTHTVLYANKTQTTRYSMYYWCTVFLSHLAPFGSFYSL